MTGVRVFQDILQVQSVVFAGGADLDLVDPLVAPGGTDRDLVAESGLAVLLGPGSLKVLLSPLGRLPIHRHRLRLGQCPFFLDDVLPGHWD